MSVARDAPVWSIGWDKRSVLLDVRADGEWHTYRLPKGSYTYDPTHGWFTEWPRIRSIGEGPMLLNMHGTFFDFPSTFTVGRTAGIRPLATHLHYTTDFTEWNGRVVLAGDDTSIQQNQLAAKPQSNLAVRARSRSSRTISGPAAAGEAPWVRDAVKAGQPSAPFLIAGYAAVSAPRARFGLRGDVFDGSRCRGARALAAVENDPRSGKRIFPVLMAGTSAEWLRVTVDRDCTATAFLHISTPRADVRRRHASSQASRPWTRRPPGRADCCVRRTSRALQFLARPFDAAGARERYYEVDEGLGFTRVDAPD